MFRIMLHIPLNLFTGIERYPAIDQVYQHYMIKLMVSPYGFTFRSSYQKTNERPPEPKYSFFRI